MNGGLWTLVHSLATSISSTVVETLSSMVIWRPIGTRLTTCSLGHASLSLANMKNEINQYIFYYCFLELISIGLSCFSK